jgi:branched-chain amino acid transport system substrate-binding protein
MTVIGSDGWDSPQLREIGGDSLNGSYYCTHFLPTDPDPVVQRFVSAYRKKHKSDPSMGEALGYDAIRLLADAMARSSVSDPEKIRDALAMTKDFPGVTGKISMDQHRNAIKPLIIVKIENQTAHLFQKIL